MKTVYEGIQVDNIDYLTDEAPAEQRKKLIEHYPINNLKLTGLQLQTEMNALAKKVEQVDFTAANFTTSNQDRIYLNPNVANRLQRVPAEVRNRTQPVCIKRGYQDEDLIRYQLPANYKPEFIPEPVSVKNAFGEFSSTVHFTDGKLEYKRFVKVNEVTRPAGEYDALLELYQAIYDADHRSVTLTVSK